MLHENVRTVANLIGFALLVIVALSAALRVT